MTEIERTGAASSADHRASERVSAELRTIVQVKEGTGETWKEVTRVTTISRNGAGFCLSRPVIVGRLVTLVMPLDSDLRAYDRDKEFYPVMGIVQYCNASTVDGEKILHVGVGFIGKEVPETFKADPTQNFRIAGMTTEGLWKVTEAETQFKKRRQPRYWIGLGVTISLLQRGSTAGARARRPQRKHQIKEETFTVNVGAGGVSVACSLDVAPGEKIKFACHSLNFYAIAVVRNRKLRDGEMPTLHLQFVDSEFPVEKALANSQVALAA